MKKILNEYDEAKKMLALIRNFKTASRPLTEQEEVQNDIDVVNDVDIKMLSNDNLDLKLTDNQKNVLSSLVDSFREQVIQTAQLEPGFTFKNDEIRFDGFIAEYDIKFAYIAGNNFGVYINAEMMKLDDESLQILVKLNHFEKQMIDALNGILRERSNN